ncbi:hypothetical protein [Ferruginibacter sp.]|nr:hypothetical protein [Ferruginibacter sp.]
MGITNRKFSSNKYRYSINGQEKETELNENITTAMYWEYDSRIGRRWNVDPVIKYWESPYACFNNSPIFIADPSGLDGIKPKPKYKTLETIVVLSRPSKKKSSPIPAKSNIRDLQLLDKKPVGLDGVKITYYTPELKSNLTGILADDYNRTPQKQPSQFNLNYAIGQTSNILEHGEYLAESVGAGKLSKNLGTAGNIVTGVSIVNNVAHRKWWEAAKDGGEFIIGKTAAAPYYYGGKTLVEVFAGNTTKSKAYYAFEEEKNALYRDLVSLNREDSYNNNNANQSRINNLSEKITKIARAQKNILESLVKEE